MKPNEVIIMRDQLAEELREEQGIANSNLVADWLVGQGWDTDLPEIRVEDD